MDKGNKKEQQFGNDIDRLIDGDQPVIKEASDKEYTENVQFAKKMVDSRIEPTPAFKENLRTRLLSKITERELEDERKGINARGFWLWVGNIIPRSPAWRTVAAVVAVFIITFIIVWRLGILAGPTNPPPILGSTSPPIATVKGPIEVTATTSKSTYVVGEEIDITLTIKNLSREALTITPFPPEIIIAAASLKPYKTIVGEESKSVAPGETIEQIFVWDQLDNEGLQVPAGNYVVNMLDIELGSGKGVVTLPEIPHFAIIAP